ncbi:MAG TPA: glycoside hydrolase family 88 protein [Pseudonocardiaceae bacterium]|nr:glycoside hydrolase family 88 protein [Pseudonocardiaceae bacterium]
MITKVTRRFALLATLFALIAGLVTPTAAAATPAKPTDWSTAVVNSIMSRDPSATKLGGWGYQVGFALYGAYLVYQRTHSPAYLKYIENWVDTYVDANGNINQSFNSLDSMQAGNLLVLLYQQTKQAKYQTAAAKIRARFNTYPRTSDGGMWHSTGLTDQLWLDGTYMSMPFLLRYGNEFNDQAYAQSQAASAVLIDASHLQAPNGLLYHAYDQNSISWQAPGTKHSPEFWCRAIGWYGMTTVDTLDNLPATAAQRPAILTILRNLVAGMARYQDPKTGRWFQVVDKGSTSGNWTETSCSAMYTYVIDKSVKEGYVASSYHANAVRGYNGVLAEVSKESNGLIDIKNICEGTDVGNLAYYLARPRATNDPHGLGAFLVMNEEYNGNPLA